MIICHLREETLSSFNLCEGISFCFFSKMATQSTFNNAMFISNAVLDLFLLLVGWDCNSKIEFTHICQYFSIGSITTMKFANKPIIAWMFFSNKSFHIATAIEDTAVPLVITVSSTLYDL